MPPPVPIASHSLIRHEGDDDDDDDDDDDAILTRSDQRWDRAVHLCA